jgi:hypothetical protein
MSRNQQSGDNMNKRLLSAATAVALGVLAAPADAYEDPRGPDRHFYDYQWDQRSSSSRADDESEASQHRQRRHHAERPRSRSQAQAKSPRGQAANVRQTVTTPAPAQLAAALPQDAPKPDAQPAAPSQKLAAAIAQDVKPETKPLVPFVEPRPKHSARDGRGCLRQAARDLLERIETEFGPMQLISTCRPGARIAGSGRISKHASGEAIDFNAGARKSEVVRWLIANHKSGGTMTYAGMSHVHVDVGRHFVALNSGGGRRR